MSKHKYSTITLVIILFLIVGGIGISTNTNELDAYFCDQEGHILYRNATQWMCARMNNIITVTNLTTINNQTIYNSSILNVTGKAYFQDDIGIGTNNPNQIVTIEDINPGIQFLDSSGTADWDILVNSNDFSIREGIFGSAPDTRLHLKTGGNVGIGTTEPLGKIHVEDSGFPVGHFVRTTTATSGAITGLGGIASGYSLRTKTSGNMGDGFGGGIILSGQDDTSSGSLTQGVFTRLYSRRDGSDTTGLFQIMTKGSNSQLPTTTFRASGRVGIGTTAPSSLLGLDGGTGAINTGITFGDGDSGIYEYTDDDIIITPSLGVGTTGFEPENVLHVNSGANNGNTKFESEDPLVLLYLLDDTTQGSGYFIARSKDDLRFYINDTIYMYMDDDAGEEGYIGIGTTTPNERLDVNGNVDIRNNLDVTNNITGNFIYGELHGQHIGTVNIVSTNTYYEVTNTTTGYNNGFTYSGGGLIANKEGIYQVVSQWSFSDGANTEFHLSLGISGVQQDKCHAERKLGTGGDVGSASYTCLISINTNDNITMIIENVDNTNDPDIHDIQLNLIRIGD